MDNQQVRLTKQDLIPVPELLNYYVDTIGNIYSTAKTEYPKKLRPYKHWGNNTKKPYLRLRIKDKLYLAHRIIASVHVGRQLRSDEVVNHIDACTTNNCLSNLEVVSQRENVKHAVDNKLYCSGDAWYKARGITKS